jgi:prepilin-type N-terminal cleavage/methylation domain-containing protein
MKRAAFTMIELLVVLSILAILAGLIVVGMGDILHRARVQRSVAAFVQTTNLAQQMAMSYRRVYSIAFNSAKEPGTTSGTTTPLSWEASDRYYGKWSSSCTSDLYHTQTTPAPMWSDRPEDQWYALMGPWQDSTGAWYQARGGMPRRDRSAGLRIGDTISNMDGSDQIGGAFGPANSDPVVAVTGANNSWDIGRPANEYPTVRITPPSDWPTAWQWDPYGVQVGPRRFLTRGTRWVARFDCPEWAAVGTTGAGDAVGSNGRNAGNLTAAFLVANAAHVATGRSNATNETAVTTTFNFYPNGMIDRNQCPNVESYAPCGQNFDQTTMGFVGICSTTTRPATFQAFTNTGANDTSKPLLSYNRPVAMQWMTLFSNGQVIVNASPRKEP